MPSQKPSTASISAVVRQGRQDRFDDRLDKARHVARELGRQRMGAEKGSSDRYRPLLSHAPGGEQRFALVRQIEAVTGFDLDRRDALADQCVETWQALADEFVLARGAQGFDRGYDAAAGASDLFITRAAQPHLEFARAVSGVDEVGMAIDQAGRDPATFAGDGLFRVPQRGWQVGLLACEHDPSIANRERAPVETPRPGRRGASVAKRAPVQRRSHEIWPSRADVMVPDRCRFCGRCGFHV